MLIIFTIIPKTGRIGYHKDSPWANCFEKVGFKGFIVNIGYLGWRILDFGRIAVWILVSLSENFWIYPPKVSKGWDSTLAHLPYYKLRLQFLEYLDANNIDFKDVDTFFPSYHSAAVIDLKTTSAHSIIIP